MCPDYLCMLAHKRREYTISYAGNIEESAMIIGIDN